MKYTLFGTLILEPHNKLSMVKVKSRLTLYINNKYYVAAYNGSSLTSTTLNDTVPQLDDIYPKHINCDDTNKHFILDTDNRFHMILYENTRVILYYDMWSGSTIDAIMMKVYTINVQINLLLFAFDKTTNTFTIQTTIIEDYECINQYKIHDPITPYVHKIQDYEFIHYDSIMLRGFNNDTHIYNNDTHQFDVFYGVDCKLYVKGREIFVEYDSILYRGTIDQSTNKLTKGLMIRTIPDNLFYRYHGSYCDTIVTTTDGNLVINNEVIPMDMTTYITTIYLDGYAFIIFTTDIFLTNKRNWQIPRLSLDNHIKSAVITHHLTKQFEWTKDIHRYFPNDKKNIINTVVLCNKITKYKKVPKYLLFNIISLFINK